MSFSESMRELESYEIDSVSGAYNASYILIGMLATGIGVGLTLSGLGTPISWGGAFLASEGATLTGIGLAS